MTVEGGDEMNARMTAAIAALAVLALAACSPHAAESAPKPTPVHADTDRQSTPSMLTGDATSLQPPPPNPAINGPSMICARGAL